MCSILVYLSIILLATNTALCSSEAVSQHGHLRDQPQNLVGGIDLYRFVSRPDLMAPKFDVHAYDNSCLSAGYWFLSPYTDLRERAPSSLFKPGQTGPHIYDGSGNLIWSGAHLFGDRSTFDFKKSSYNGRAAMTFIVDRDRSRKGLKKGAGVILDDSYRVTETIRPGLVDSSFNMHEFTLTENNTGLMITFQPKYTDVTYSFDDPTFRIKKDEHNISSKVGNNGFREFDLRTGATVFEWWALDHLHPSESLVQRPDLSHETERAWDFFHQNSVDKDNKGNYLISSRYLNAIFKISGADGSVIWQLGGRRSSFAFQDGLNFSSQHDARWRSQNSTHEIITFLDNAADDKIVSSDYSSAMTIELDLTEMKATLLHKFDRPDYKLTRLRGNVQQLANGNTFVCWSENGHISEFDSQGKLLLDASFQSHRFVTYRGYKFDFVGRPSEPIAVKTLIHGPSSEHSTTSIYVSWNGATEVASWRFYESTMSGTRANLLGERARTGFETVMMVSGTACQTFVEAVSSNGTVIGVSELAQSVLPSSWDRAICQAPLSNNNDEAGEESSRAVQTDKGMLDAISWGIGYVSVSTAVFVALCFCGVAMVTMLAAAAYKIRKLRRILDAQSLPIARHESESLLHSFKLDPF